MLTIDYAKLCSSILEPSDAVAISLRHNLALLRAIHWGAKGVLGSELEFDPRANFWQPPERRFLIAFLSDTWRDWPRDPSKHPALERFCVALATGLDRPRQRGMMKYIGVDYDEAGGVTKVLAPVRDLLTNFDDHGWTACRPRRYAERSAAEALLGFLDRVEADGFSKHERSLQDLMRWWAVLGARNVAQLVERQRFFWLYRLLLCTSNAYVNAGAQYFGPVIGNTRVSLFREVIRRWRDGATPREVPLMAHDKDTDEITDRSHTNIARELWGFLNLQRGPFYNAQAAEAYLGPGEDPIAATLRIGAGTRAWLDAHPSREAELSAMFGEWLARAQRAGLQPLAKVRRFERRFDAAGDAIDSGAPLDDELNAELVEQGSKYLLDLLSRGERAAIMLHLALDATVYSGASLGHGGAPLLDATLATGGAGPSSPSLDAAARLRASKTVWIYAPGGQASEFARDRELGLARVYWDEITDIRSYATREALFAALQEQRGKDAPSPIHDSWSLWRFAREVKPGDIILARRGLRTIVGVGEVSEPYSYDADASGSHRVGVDWSWHGEIGVTEGKQMAMQTFVNGSHRKPLLEQLARELRGAAAPDDDDDDDPTALVPAPVAAKPFGLDDALEQLFFTRAQISKWQRLLERRRNLVLMGPPGVGKTYVAKRLAKLLTGVDSDERVQIVQFHQAYSYEQFVLGYRPAGGSGSAPSGKPQFELAKGPLFRVAEQAMRESDSPFVLIIDEINRGNISRILGEALMLLEHDKRDAEWGLELAYGLGDSEFEPGKFYLPPNLYVIGTMNTADRSLAVVDYALRRRFAFVEVEPRIDSDEFTRHASELRMPDSALARLRERIAEINKMIEEDRALGRGFAIGHSFFTVNVGPDQPAPWDRVDGDPEALAHEWLDDVFDCEIEPLLAEYWAESREHYERAHASLWKGRARR